MRNAVLGDQPDQTKLVPRLLQSRPLNFGIKATFDDAVLGALGVAEDDSTDVRSIEQLRTTSTRAGASLLMRSSSDSVCSYQGQDGSQAAQASRTW
jgi:hypothetical protein